MSVRRRELVFALVVTLAVIGAATMTVIADWQPADGHKMHFPQMPDEAGWDVNATAPLVLADDWMCSETGWVKDVHFWGSWRDGIVGQINYFVLSIHKDIPADQSPTGFSMPGETLWEREVSNWVAVPIDPPTMEGWYDPQLNLVLPNNHQAYFQYNVFLPEADWFHQDSGTIYWLNISAVLQDPGLTQWGWKSTLNHWNDDAVWAQWGLLNWQEMYEPQVVDTLRNGFNITLDPMGNFVTGSGQGAYGNGWYYYPPENWWNIWFYDHPLDASRFKQVRLELMANRMIPGQPAWLEIAVNWSTDVWSLEGHVDPPLPGVDEHLYIGRGIVFADSLFGGTYTFEFLIPDYNPEWVSVDVRGYNFQITDGLITHICAPKEPPPSLDLSFVITG